MIQELQVVILDADLPSEHLVKGDMGTVVHVHRDGQAYEVEFMTMDGETVALVTLENHQVRPKSGREVPHSRPFDPRA